MAAWWPRNSPTNLAADRIGQLCQRRITDSDAEGHPTDALAKRASGYSPGDTDLAWARITPWRALMTSLLDQPPYEKITAATVGGSAPGSPIALSYGDIFLQTEREYSRWNFETADTAMLLQHFKDAEAECARILDAPDRDGAGRRIPMAHPAYDQAIKASHTFNLLQARGVISVAERQAYIGRVRDLAKAACAAHMERNAADWQARFPDWSAA